MADIGGYEAEAIEYRSDKDTHFTGGLAQNAGEFETLSRTSGNPYPASNRFIIEKIAVQSDQNLDWDVVLWSGAAADATDLDADLFVEYEAFATTAGKQIAGANQFYYATSGLSIPYIDGDVERRSNSPQVHVTLVNRNAAAKNAGATGEVVVVITMRPVYGL